MSDQTNNNPVQFTEYRQRLRDNLPESMKAQTRFVRWFQGTSDTTQGSGKILRGKVNDPSTWSTFDECVAALTEKDAGIGYVFTDGELFGLDLDHVRNATTGVLCPEADVILKRFGSYAEVSVSGTGLHVLFTSSQEITRYKKLTGGHVEFWHPAHSPRFFTLSGEVLPGYNTLRDGKDAFLYLGSTVAHVNARLREEIATIDPEQAAKLHPLKEMPQADAPGEKQKRKTRVVKKDFNIKDYLAFNKLKVINETDNELGHCLRLSSCPIKGEPHAGHNNTTTNFIYPAKDGGLAFHCFSNGCEESPVHDVIKLLADLNGVYEPGIYEEKPSKNNSDPFLSYSLFSFSELDEACLTYLWPKFLPDNKLVHFYGASSEGKSPVTIDLIARVSSGREWPYGTPNTHGPRSVILLASEDDLQDTVLPRLRLAGADTSKVHGFKVTAKKNDTESERNAAIDRDSEGLLKMALSLPDLALIVIDPITNYLGNQGMNKEEDIRGNISMPLKGIAKDAHCCVITVGHINRRDKDATPLQRGMGAAAFTGVPRKAFLFGNDPENENKFAHVMKETRDKEVAIQYETQALPDPTGKQKAPIIKVVWGKQVEVDADDVLNAPKQKEKSTTSDAVMLIRGLLKAGVVRKSDIDLTLKENGIDAEKLQWSRIKTRCKAETRPIKGKGPGAGWEWYLPAPEQAEFDSLTK